MLKTHARPSEAGMVMGGPTVPRRRMLSWPFWIVSIVLTLLGVVLLSPFQRRIIERESRVDMEMSQILAAIEQYKAAVETATLDDGRTVFRALRGQNPMQVVFYVCSAEGVSKEGNLLDPWGTPYKLYFSGRDILLRSAGPNRHFDDLGGKDCDDVMRSMNLYGR